MSRIRLRSNRVVLCLSLAAFAASIAGVSCSSSDSSPAADGAAGKKPSGRAGAGNTASGGDIEEASGGEAPGPVDAGGTGNEAGTATVDPEPDAGSGPVAGGSSGKAGSGAGGSGTAGGSATDPNAAAIQHAKAVIDALAPTFSSDKPRQCPVCHQQDYSGLGYWPNITPNDKDCKNAGAQCGIGTWTDEQIKAAIVDGKDADGSTLCGQMARYKFTSSELNDIVIYLRSLPAKTKEITAECTASN